MSQMADERRLENSHSRSPGRQWKDLMNVDTFKARQLVGIEGDENVAE